MKITAFALLLAAPLAAQSFEAGLFVGQSFGKDTAVLALKNETKNATVVSGRIGYALLDFGPTLLQVTAAYQPKAESKLEIAGVEQSFKYGHSYTAVGAAFNLKMGVAFGVGVDYRFEKLTLAGSPDTTYNRPWARANLGFAIPSPLVKPFLGVEVAVPMTSKSLNVSTATTEDYLKALAPKLQVGIYGGIRF